MQSAINKENYKDLENLISECFHIYESGNEDIVSLGSELVTFLQTGTKNDAFSVFFAFCQTFKVFGNGYESISKLLSLLSKSEERLGGLVQKQRDHYSHSVYVFATGLAIYAKCKTVREAIQNKYGFDAKLFLKLWGYIALFHDIGYPLQLAHDNVKTYLQEAGMTGDNNLFVTFGNFDSFISLDDEQIKNAKDALNIDVKTINDLLAVRIEENFGFSKEETDSIIQKRTLDQTIYLDHGYFSAVFLSKIFTSKKECLDQYALDILNSIFIHNDLLKFDDGMKGKRVSLFKDPLSYLLLLCDETQAWDRTPYGLISKKDPLAWKAVFSISDDVFRVRYLFNSSKIIVFKDGKEDSIDNKGFIKFNNGKVVADLETLFEPSPLKIIYDAVEKEKELSSRRYFSNAEFLDLLDLAKRANDSYFSLNKSIKKIEFEDQPLGYQLSNINQVKSYSYLLELVNCFFIDQEMDLPIVTELPPRDLDYLCREEHARWSRERMLKGWRYGTSYVEDAKGDHALEKKLKDERKENICIVPFELLTEEQKEYDVRMIKNIIPFLYGNENKYRVYRYVDAKKQTTNVAVVSGLISSDNIERSNERFRTLLFGLSRYSKVVVWLSFATDLDIAFAETALELGIVVKAVLPWDYNECPKRLRENYEANGLTFDENKWRSLLSCTVVCHVASENGFKSVFSRLVLRANKVIASLEDGDKILFGGNGVLSYKSGDDSIAISNSRVESQEDIITL